MSLRPLDLYRADLVFRLLGQGVVGVVRQPVYHPVRVMHRNEHQPVAGDVHDFRFENDGAAAGGDLHLFLTLRELCRILWVDLNIGVRCGTLEFRDFERHGPGMPVFDLSPRRQGVRIFGIGRFRRPLVGPEPDRGLVPVGLCAVEGDIRCLWIELLDLEVAGLCRVAAKRTGMVFCRAWPRMPWAFFMLALVIPMKS